MPIEVNLKRLQKAAGWLTLAYIATGVAVLILGDKQQIEAAYNWSLPLFLLLMIFDAYITITATRPKKPLP